MKGRTLLSLITALAVGMASAQTQFGQVTLTPVQPAPRASGGVKPKPIGQPLGQPVAAPPAASPVPVAAPAAAPRPAPNVTPDKASASASASAGANKTFTPQVAPQGSYNLTGKVTGLATRLPAGSKVVLMVQDRQAPGTPLLSINFGAASLPVSYQMYFTKSRLKAERTYSVQAKIFNAAGALTHLSAPVALPAASPATLDLAVQAAR